MVTSLLSSPPTSISITHKLNNWVFNPNITCHFKLIKNNSSSSFPQNKTLICSTRVDAIPTQLASNASRSTHQRHWIVVMDTPPTIVSSRPQIIDYYVQTIQPVLGSKKGAEMCIYDASCDTHFGFCCDVDEEMAREIACLPGVLSVRPDLDFHIVRKDSSYYKVQLHPRSSSFDASSWLVPLNNPKYWLVRTERPLVGVLEKPQVVDYYVQILSKILGNVKDAQMCMYNVFWQSNFGFCSVLDDACAHELAGVPGVLSVQPDENWDCGNKYSGGESMLQSSDSADSLAAAQTISIGTKKLFVTGLSFYTSEKTLREAFQGFGELVDVRIIMDKISKRSKGYAFIEYTTEAAASAALKEMNGKLMLPRLIRQSTIGTDDNRFERRLQEMIFFYECFEQLVEQHMWHVRTTYRHIYHSKSSISHGGLQGMLNIFNSFGKTITSVVPSIWGTKWALEIIFK